MAFPKRCPQCKLTKPASPDPDESAFPWDKKLNRPRSWCRECKRLITAMKRTDPAMRERERLYRRQPKVVERQRRHNAGNAPARKLYLKTVKGRLISALCKARDRVTTCKTEAGRDRNRKAVETCERLLHKLADSGRYSPRSLVTREDDRCETPALTRAAS